MQIYADLSKLKMRRKWKCTDAAFWLARFFLYFFLSLSLSPCSCLHFLVAIQLMDGDVINWQCCQIRTGLAVEPHPNRTGPVLPSSERFSQGFLKPTRSHQLEFMFERIHWSMDGSFPGFDWLKRISDVISIGFHLKSGRNRITKMNIVVNKRNGIELNIPMLI